jgi:hypothetical protein
MATDIVSWIAVGMILATSATILISRDWRVPLGALAVQYIAAFWLVTRHLPFVMGSAKLITGWMVVAALGMTRLGLTSTEESADETSLLSGRWFRATLIGIVALVSIGATSRIETSIPGLGLQVIAGSLILIGAASSPWGHIGCAASYARFAYHATGFEILYAAVESSI